MSLRHVAFSSFFLTAALFVSCGNEQDNSTGSETKDFADQYDDNHVAVIQPEKVFQLEGMAENYSLSVTRDEIQLPDHPGENTLTVRIFKARKPRAVLEQTVVANEIGEMETPCAYTYWLPLVESGGGSGYMGKLYCIRFLPYVTMDPIFSFHELNRWKANEDATKIVLFNGTWDMTFDSLGNHEGHFEPHYQQVSVYHIFPDSIAAEDAGTTKNKYDFEEAEDTYDLFAKQEPHIAKKIHWEEFEKSPAYP